MRADDNPSTIPEWMRWIERKIRRLEQRPAGSGGGGGGVTSVNGDTGPAVSLVATDIPSSPTGTIAATNVQAAIAELDGDTVAVAAGLAAHIADAVDAHDASAISNVPAGTIAATTVQGAIDELATEKISGVVVQDEGTTIITAPQMDFLGAGVTVTAGTGEAIVTIPGGVTSVNGDTGPSVTLVASEIGSTATGDVAATDVQGAIAELAAEKIPVALVDAKGDLLVGTANDTIARQAVGTDGHILTADSSVTNGMKWAATTIPTPNTPTVSAVSTVLVNNANSVSATIPAGASTGELLVMFTAHGFATTVPLTGWDRLGSGNGANSSMTVFSRKCLVGDPGTNVTVNFAGVYYGTVYIVAVAGFTKVSDFAITQTTGGSPLVLLAAISVATADLALIFGQARATNTTVTSSVGTLHTNRTADANTGSALYTFTAPGGPLAATITSSVGPLGMNGAIVSITGT